MDVLDKRLTPFKKGIAADFLGNQINPEGIKFVKATPYQVGGGLIPLKSSPEETARRVSELHYGEIFNVYEEKNGWGWGQSDIDGYVGFCKLEDLKSDISPVTHYVSALSSHIYPVADAKSFPVRQVHMMAEISVKDEKQTNGFVQLSDGNWITLTHIAKDYGVSPVSEAMKFLYTPYLWGGKSNAGIDCSGLVQMAFAATGVEILRDADMQLATVGRILADDEVPMNGDLAFFPGHVGFMLDDIHLLHANMHHMRVSIDPLREVLDVISFQTEEPPLTCIKRVDVIPEGRD